MRVLQVDRGFSADRVMAIDMALPELRYQDEPTRQAAYDRLLRAVRALPGIQQASTTSMLPLRGEGQVNFIAPEGSTRPASARPSANFRFVAPDYFRTLAMPMQRGRAFTDAERDPNRPAPVVVSAPTAAQLWPGEEDPIGRRFSRGIAAEQGFEVVGVVGDARTTSLDRVQPLMVYVPYWWRSRANLSLLIRSAGNQSPAAADVRRVVREVDPEISLGDVRPLEQLADTALAGRRYQVQLFAAFGFVALFIATIGVYAATTYGVAKRRREMNLRVALGASPSQVIGLILRQGSTPVLVGMLAGAVAALALGGVVSSLLFEVTPTDPLIIGTVVVLVGTVSLATSGIVTRRRLSIDPARALREE
jgi:putative ABC transport system permease protein